MSQTNRRIARALISVFDKHGLDQLAGALTDAHTEVVSTGATAERLSGLGVHVTPVEQVTGFPESLNGRVKTLDPHIHAGILADMRKPDHVAQLRKLGIKPFDLVVVNLYPFARTVRSGADEAAVIEKIDIGGPSLLRAAAKNSASVAVVTDPDDYPLVAERIADGRGFTLDERRWLAAKAFAHTAAYDATIAEWTSRQWRRPDTVSQSSNPPAENDGSESFPATYTRSWSFARTLRYGENPHQRAALFQDPLSVHGFAHAEQLGGKPMSYNNYVDANSAWRSVWDFAPRIAVAVVKHSNPCGLAVAGTVAEAHRKAHACDPMSAFGGVIASNTRIDLTTAQQIKPIFTEVIVAPDYAEDALALLRTKRNLRILKVALKPHATSQIRQIDGGLLVQSEDLIDAPGDDPSHWKLAAGSKVDASALADLEFAWRAIRSVKSNAILIAHQGATVGIGMGQVNRVDSSRLAVTRANTLANGRNRTRGSVAASDAFFPFPDGLDILAEAGVTAVVEPGGSIRDHLVIDAANKAGISLYFTGTRHFFH